MPDAWTVTVKVNDSGDDAVLFGGPGNLAFDSRGYAWVANNVPQGSTYSSYFVMVLKPNGKPADGINGTPRSPLTGGGILGTGFGVTVDPNGFAWFGNFGWGDCGYCDPTPYPPGNGSMCEFTASGAPISGPEGYYKGPFRVQGVASDGEGNIWIASFGNDSAYVFKPGDAHPSLGSYQYDGAGTFGVAIAGDGSAWFSNSGGLDGGHPSSVVNYVLVNGALQQRFICYVGNNLRGLAVDSSGNVWVGSLNDNKVYGIRPGGTVIGGFSGGGMNGPWDVTVDGEDNLWVSNFGPLESGSNFTDGRLTKLAGTNPATRPPDKQLGDPISPVTGYTVHSAGEQVLLHNGDPLYGPGADPSYAPMMRQTASQIDEAGNIWSINNWKPDFDVDATSNPGGDGIIIFVGLAPPPAPGP
jgi:streptogramin lyase